MKTEIRLGDCVEGMRLLPRQSIDLVVTSPPYNLGMKYGRYNDQKSKLDYLRFTCQWTQEVFRLLRPQGSFFLNMGSSSKDPTLAFDVASKVSEVFKLQNTFHWIKSITVGDQSFGHFKPVQSDRYVHSCHEYVFHFTPMGNTRIHREAIGVPYKDKSNITRWAHNQHKGDVRCRGNTWFMPYKTIRSKRSHPCPFPEELVKNCIRIHGMEHKLSMLDPFLGCGTSAVAAKNERVGTFYGFEIDADYLMTACEALGIDYLTVD